MRLWTGYSPPQRETGTVSKIVDLQVDTDLDEQIQKRHVQLQCCLTLQFPIVQPQGEVNDTAATP
jgi:hypothetical protein